MRLRTALVCVFLAACGGARPEVTVPAPPPGAMPEVAAAAPPSTTPTPPPPALASATKVRTVEGITEYQLANGLQVLLFPDPTQSTVTVNITYLVGSRLEGYGQTGMAHLLEHMMFKGSPRHRNVLKLLDARGGQANGTTWTDRTNYYETLPASQDNLDWALDLESDRMIHASISPDDLKTEFSVVRNEFEMDENSPLSILEERIVSSAFLWHNYGKDTIGSRADIERVPVPALRAFYETYYQPDNAVLVVSGKFEDGPALASIEKLFGTIARPTRTLSPTYTIEPVQDGERTVTLRRNGDIFGVGVAYHTVGAASPDYPAIEAALDLLDREPSGRLYKKLVETKLAASISGSQNRFRDPYVAVMIAEVRDGAHLDQVEHTMIDELEHLGTRPIDPREVERWRASTQKQLDLAMADSQQIAVWLSEFAALGDWRAIFAYRDRVAKVTAADVQRVAKAYFKASNRTSGRFIPTKDADRAPLTETPDIAAVVKGIERGEVKDQGEAFVATLDNIDARTQRRNLGHGIKAALLPKKTRGAKVELRLVVHFGDEKTLQHKGVVGSLTAAMLSRGTIKKTYQDLEDEQNILKSQIGISGGASTLTLAIETFHDQLPAAIDLGAEMLTSPSFPAKQLELVKQERLASLEQQLQDPSSVAWSRLAQITSPWPKGDPRYPMTAAEQIAEINKVTLGDIKAFYREFVGAGHGELVVVGDFDPNAVAPQVDQRLSSWISHRPYARLDGKVFQVPGTTESIAIKDKEMTQLVASYDLSMRDADPDYPAWELVGQVLGGDTGSRIWMRLREKEGLSYGAAAWTFAGTLDDEGGFGAEAIVAPQNLAQAKASLIDEITRMATGQVDDAELARAKDSWIKSQDTSLSNDSYVVGMLQSQLFVGRTSEFQNQLRAHVRAVTTADLERVAHKYLDPKRLVIVDAGDSSKASAH